MRIPKSWVPSIAKRIADNLINKELLEPLVPRNSFITEIEELLTEELMAEDRLNGEVRELLKKFEPEIEKGRLDYKKLFDMTKQKLIRERNIVI